MSRDLSVVIVTHNSAGDLPDCLDSLLAHQEEVDMHVVLSDSGSTDETADVAGRYPVTFLPGENRGFAAANNRALAHADVAEARYVLFLNPDTQLLNGSLGELLAQCDARPASGTFAVRQLDEHGELIHSMFRFPRPERYWLEVSESLRKRNHGTRVVDDERYGAESLFDWAIGSFILVRGEVLRTVGWFDERFFFTSEEVDLCLRARRAGWNATYFPWFTIMHRYAPRDPDPWRAWLLVHYQACYARKWFSPLGHLLARAALAVRHGRDWLDVERPRGRRQESLFKVRAALGLSVPKRGPATPDLEAEPPPSRVFQ